MQGVDVRVAADGRVAARVAYLAVVVAVAGRHLVLRERACLVAGDACGAA